MKRLQKRYIEGQVKNENIPIVISSILQEFRKYDMKKLFMKCRYGFNGRFNPGIAFDGN